MERIMKINEIIEIIEKLETRNNSYWNFYTIVIIAICGWVLSQKSEGISQNSGYAIMFGKALFDFMNLSVIYGTTSRIVAFESELIVAAKNEPSIGPKLKEHLTKPFLEHRLKFTILTHLFMDIAVLIFIFMGIKG